MGSAQQPRQPASASGEDHPPDRPARPDGGPGAGRVPGDVALDRSFRTGDLNALRGAVTARATSLGADPEQVEALVIVASELATNAIVHGGGSGRLRLWRSAGSLALQVDDRGPGIADPQHAGTRRQEPTAIGGRGLWIVRQLCDRVTIDSGAAGTAVTVAVRVRDTHAGSPVPA